MFNIFNKIHYNSLNAFSGGKLAAEPNTNTQTEENVCIFKFQPEAAAQTSCSRSTLMGSSATITGISFIHFTHFSINENNISELQELTGIYRNIRKQSTRSRVCSFLVFRIKKALKKTSLLHKTSWS